MSYAGLNQGLYPNLVPLFLLGLSFRHKCREECTSITAPTTKAIIIMQPIIYDSLIVAISPYFAEVSKMVSPPDR